MKKCPAHNEPELGYLEWHADAAQRGKRREQQRRCKLCLLWVWEEHYIDKTAMGDTAHMENKRIRRRK